MPTLGEMNQPRTLFTVVGPRTIPTYRGKASRTITDDNVRAFWRTNADVGRLRGCYVFAVGAGSRMKPTYVGKATKSFRQEVFQYHKRVRYQQTLADCRVGVPLLFFVALPRRRGAPPTTHVAALERFLIETAHEVTRGCSTRVASAGSTRGPSRACPTARPESQARRRGSFERSCESCDDGIVVGPDVGEPE